MGKLAPFIVLLHEANKIEQQKHLKNMILMQHSYTTHFIEQFKWDAQKAK